MEYPSELNAMRHWRYLALEHKAAYRRNMLWAETIVLMVAISVGIAHFFWPKAEAELASVAIYNDLFSLRDSTSNLIAEKQHRMNKSFTSPEFRTNSGLEWASQRGYMTHIRIIRDISVAPGESRFHQYSDESNTIAAMIDVQTALSDSESFQHTATTAGYDGDSEFGKIGGRGDKHWLGHPQGWKYNDDTLYREEMGSILMFPINWPTIARVSDTGIVVIDILIDRKGQIEWTIMLEQPRGRGFANAVVESLKRSKYIPPKISGIAVEFRVQMVALLCFLCDQKLEVTQGNLTASFVTNPSR